MDKAERNAGGLVSFRTIRTQVVRDTILPRLFTPLSFEMAEKVMRGVENATIRRAPVAVDVAYSLVKDGYNDHGDNDVYEFLDRHGINWK